MNAANRVVERGNYRPVSNRCYQLQLGGNIFANFARVFFEEKNSAFALALNVVDSRFNGYGGKQE